MPCYQNTSAPAGFSPSGQAVYQSEAECLEACKEGACCNGTTCSVKPQCQCDAAAGEVFKGVGTVCSPNPCGCCGGGIDTPESLILTVSNMRPVPPLARLFIGQPQFSIEGEYIIPRQGNDGTPCEQYFLYDRQGISNCPWHLAFDYPSGFDLVVQIFSGLSTFGISMRGVTLGDPDDDFISERYDARCLSFSAALDFGSPLAALLFCGNQSLVLSGTSTASGSVWDPAVTINPSPGSLFVFDWSLAAAPNPLP